MCDENRRSLQVASRIIVIVVKLSREKSVMQHKATVGSFSRIICELLQRMIENT